MSHLKVNTTSKNTTKVFAKAKAWISSFWLSIREKAPKAIWKFLKRAIRISSRALAGAIIFAFMAELAPALRETLPNFYQIIDLALKVLEVISIKALECLQHLM